MSNVPRRGEARVSVAQAKEKLSDLLGRVAYGGERITITKRGRPIARLVPIRADDDRPRLADARGWLRDEDPFVREIERIVAERRQHPPRSGRR